MIAQRSFIILLLIAFTSLAIAGDVNINRCNLRIANALNRLEIKGASALDIIEIKIDKPIDYIFGENKLSMAPLESKFEEKKALYRYPGVASRVHTRFESVKFIKDMPDKDIAKLLEPNTIYTYTIQDKKLSIAKSKPGIIRDYASKHMLLSADEKAGELRMAGEMWVDNLGVLHYDPGSGTYKPSAGDLKRPEVFLKNHLGIEASQAHYFEAPIEAAQPVVAAKKTPLATKINAIELAQSAILQKRRVLAGYKFTVVSQYRMNEVDQKLRKENLTFSNSFGQVEQYKLVRINPVVTEVVDFDDKNGSLRAKNEILRQTRSYNLQDESKMKPMKANREAHSSALSAHKEPLSVVASTRTEEVEYGLYKLAANGKLASAPSAKVIMVTTNTTKDGVNKSEYSAIIEAPSINKKDGAPVHLMDQIQKMLELN